MTVLRAFIITAVVCLCLTGLSTVSAADDLPTGTGVEDNCIVVYDFPDAGYAICQGDGDCTLYERRTTFTGTEERCLV